MQANVIVVGAAHGVEQLTYAIPPALEGSIRCGHRVVAPLRSRRVTGVVAEVGENLSAADLKPLLEVLEPEPLFDAAHLRLMEFLATYYMAPLGDAYRSVIPAAARVESRTVYRAGVGPDALRRAAFTRIERAIADAVAKRAMTARQLLKLGAPGELRSALARLEAEGIIERRDAARGRHRERNHMIARVKSDTKLGAVRGAKQRKILDAIAGSGAAGITVEHLREQVADSAAPLKSLARRGIVELVREETVALAPSESAPAQFELTAEQQAAIDAIAPALEHRRFETFLLWGVTASGKTEVYLQLAARALQSGRQVLVLVPEIALADEQVRAFRARFGALAAVAHSAQTVAERWANWMAALRGRARIMIGPRSAIFAPIHDLGLIVVDEEHDAAYKNEEGIRYHARDLAVALGGYAECPVVLGSATPSAESFANARRGRYRMLRLPRRANHRPMAQVEVVDLRRERSETAHVAAAIGNGAAANGAGVADAPIPLSRALVDALKANLAARGQSMVFLNRRGFHNFLQCHLCGNVIACPNCSVSMTFHLRDRSLRCHYCGNRAAAPDKCPECGGFGLAGQGFGTERLVGALQSLMPGARIERMDSDTSGRRGARARILAELRAGTIDVLVGTQMITKGFDFPGVTLAAVVLADLALNLPDFRSAERTFQLLTQVAGRAGRGERPGRVVIQTFAPHHYSIRAARDQDYARFMRRELELRRALDYPPFARLAMVRIEGTNPRAASALAADAARVLGKTAPSDKVRVLGPAPAPIERIKQRYRWQVMLKSRELRPMRTALAAMRTELGERARRDRVMLAIDIDPVRMM
jgi:primosomal protein N' (replication factor Y) (superfamily II helicase)